MKRLYFFQKNVIIDLVPENVFIQPKIVGKNYKTSRSCKCYLFTKMREGTTLFCSLSVKHTLYK